MDSYEIESGAVPELFAEDVCGGEERGQIGRLGLLGLEARGYGWGRAGLELVGNGLARIGGAGASRVGRQLGWEGIGADGGGGAEWDHAIVFTGHMIDAPGREKARFPESAEGAARAAILRAVSMMIERSAAGASVAPAGRTVGVAGGASGGDLLFHEVCAELGLETVLRLTLPVEAFVEASVAAAGREWVERFATLRARLAESSVEVLGEGTELPQWMGARPDYDVWQRTNLWLLQEAIAFAPRRTLLALWDGEPGDGPGGTQHLVEAAPQFGIEVAPPIMTGELLAGAGE